MRSPFHFDSFKPPDMEKQAPAKEYDNGNPDKYRKYIAGSNYEIIYRAQKMKEPLRTRSPVDHHFNASEDNYTEAPENKCMEQPENRPAEDLCLSESHLHHHAEALPDILYRKTGTGKAEKPCQPPHGIEENP